MIVLKYSNKLKEERNRQIHDMLHTFASQKVKKGKEIDREMDYDKTMQR